MCLLRCYVFRLGEALQCAEKQMVGKHAKILLVRLFLGRTYVWGRSSSQADFWLYDERAREWLRKPLEQNGAVAVVVVGVVVIVFVVDHFTRTKFRR